MSLFLITFFLLYGGLHSYVFFKVWNAFHFRWVAGSLLTLLFLAMVIAPLIVRILEKSGEDTYARCAAYAGYTWLGLISIFFSISICIDSLRLVAYLTGIFARTDFSAFICLHKVFFLIAFLGCVGIGIYGYREAGDIRVQTLHIYTPKISKETGKLVIAQISDVHLGLLVREERLKQILNLVREAHPDMLVCTGDLVDGDLDKVNGLVSMLKEIEPRYGKFAITGNHEFIAGIEKSLDFISKTGFTMLRGQALTVSGLINIAGVDDPSGGASNYRFVPEKTLLANLPQGLFTLLLKHRPVVDQGALGLFDLQLSGHTHKGQIYPFRYLTRLFFPLYTGYHKLPNGAHLYVTNGSGTWGPPMRFVAPPEVTVIELVHE